LVRTLLIAGLAAAIFSTDATTAAPRAGLSREDIRSVVGLVKSIYSADGDFLETVPWDRDTGRLARRVHGCVMRSHDKIVDEDWPTDSQGQTIKNLTVTFDGSPGPGRAKVRARFLRAEGPTVVDYDVRHAHGRWSIGDMHVRDERGIRNLRTWLMDTLATDCKGF
jgi:hypothetical protein